MTMAAAAKKPDTEALPVAQTAQLPEVAGSAALMSIIERAALSPDFDVEKLEKLLAMKERWEAAEARKAFVAAKAAFKAEAPTLAKNKHVNFKSKSTGGETDYWHATLDNIAAQLAPALAKHGLSYSWETKQAEGGLIEVTCALTHVMGHSERVSLRGSPDQSGNKNNIQAVGSTVTYLSRYTLLAVTGMATAGQDDDGAGGPVELISAAQKDELIALLRETASDTKKFLDYLGVESLDALPLDMLDHARAVLEKKRKSV